MTEDNPRRGRAARIVVITGCLLLVAAACGFSRDGLTTARGTDTSQLTDGTVPDSDLTDSGLATDTGDTYSDTFDQTDSYTDSTDSSTDSTTSSSDSSTDSGPPIDATPLIPLLIDPPSLPTTPPAPGPPDRAPARPDGSQDLIYGTYTYDNLDDFLYGDWNCLGCDTDVASFQGAVDKLAREPGGKFWSNSVARFSDPLDATDLLGQLADDRAANDSQIWQSQIPTVPEIPGASASLGKQTTDGQDYEVRFVVRGDLYVLDFGSGSGTPVDMTTANATAKLQYQKALNG